MEPLRLPSSVGLSHGMWAECAWDVKTRWYRYRQHRVVTATIPNQPSHAFLHSGQPSGEICARRSQLLPHFLKWRILKTCTRRLTEATLELQLHRNTLG